MKIYIVAQEHIFPTKITTDECIAIEDPETKLFNDFEKAIEYAEETGGKIHIKDIEI
jgi:hypothetical protein